MNPIPQWCTPQLLEELCRRSAAGEGVLAVIREKGLPETATLIWLRDHHRNEIVAAKREHQAKGAAT